MAKRDDEGIVAANRAKRAAEIAKISDKAYTKAAALKDAKDMLAADRARRDARAAELYDKSYKFNVDRYAKELRDAPEKENPLTYKLVKFGDRVGDKVRSVGKFFGSNQMTSLDDEAQMQARKDIKGYKKGGSVKSSASKRADGIAQRGKTRGKLR